MSGAVEYLYPDDHRRCEKARKLNREIVEYSDDPKRWRRQMNKLARDLEAVGL